MMYVLCDECKQHYDDLEAMPEGEGVNHRHYRVGVRPADERVATAARTALAAKRARTVAGTA